MTEFVHGHDPADDGRPSKSQRKRDVTALQKLGESLVELKPDQVERMGLPEDLAEAIRFYHSLKDKEARRRHLQFIGAVMRRIDPEPVRQALEALDQLRYQQAEDFHRLEEWRDALVAGDEGLLGEMVRRFGLDRHQVHQIVKAAAAEKAAGNPSKNGRNLFRLLRRGFELEGRQN
ncbi:MAG: DUF615 domain-containing protein [Desulfovibrionales bacterium]|nr:DUF615 domain-containing protein [Desulfovibrionales bacterium]